MPISPTALARELCSIRPSLVPTTADEEERQAAIPSDEELLFLARPARCAHLRRRAGIAGTGAAVFALAVILVRRHGGQTSAGLGAVQSLQQREEVDVTTMCVGQGDDCRTPQCCQTASQSCFEKNQYWAACMDTCDAGQPQAHDPDPEAWTCKKLGERSKFEPGCAWAGDDCSTSKRCCQQGFQCMEKNQYWSACTQVEQGPWSDDGAPAARLPPPKGWAGTELGGWRSEYQVYGVSGDYAARPSLFCFMAVLPGSPEMALVEEARKRQAGIWGCEARKVFHSKKSDYHEWSETGVTTLANTDVFVKIWDQVKEDGQYLLQDWTVKVDADCVWFPARLRSHLQALKAPAYTPIYIKNTLPRYTLGGWLGAIEIFSKTAVEAYTDNAAECVEHIGTNSGEDGFLKDCMDALGVGWMRDELIVHPSDSRITCQVGEFVAFHPIKAPEDWAFCYDLAEGTIQPPPPIMPGAIALLPDAIREKYEH